MNRRLAMLSALLVLLTSCAASSSIGLFAARPAARCSWVRVPVHAPGSDVEFTGVSGTSDSDAWAVGFARTTAEFTGTLAEHWNGSRWTRVATPNPSGQENYLLAVDEITPSSVWAVGIADGGPNRFAQPLAEHWDGTSWSVVPIPAPGTEGFLNAVSSSSATDVWAVGFDDSKGSIGGRTLTEHWNEHRWSVVPSPNKGIINNELHGVSVVAGDSAWAVGTRWNGADPSSGGKPLVERWDGHGWSIVTAPAPVPNDSALNAVWAKGGRAWAVGGAPSGRLGDQGTLAERWTGSKWAQVPADNPGSGGLLEGVAGFRGGAWAVGSWLNSSGASRALIEGWNGESFVVEPTHIPGSESGFQAIWAASATSAWAVGSYTVGRRTYPFIMRCAAPSFLSG